MKDVQHSTSKILVERYICELMYATFVVLVSRVLQERVQAEPADLHSSQYYNVVVLQDYLTKWVEAFAVPNQTA